MNMRTILVAPDDRTLVDRMRAFDQWRQRHARARWAQRLRIAIPANPSPAEALAADELAKYVRRCPARQLPVQRGGAVPARALVIADDQHSRKIGAGTVGETYERYLISLEHERVNIGGFRPRATLYGVYALLDSLGCRFLSPQFDHYAGAAEVIPQTKTITINLREPITSRPRLTYRKLYIEEGISHDEANLKQLIEWMPKVGYNVLVCPLDYGNRGG
jgi:hypothetical protein